MITAMSRKGSGRDSAAAQSEASNAPPQGASGMSHPLGTS